MVKLDEYDAKTVAELLCRINPSVWTDPQAVIDHMQRMAERLVREKAAYGGTGGYYVTVFQMNDATNDWHAKPTIMAYSVLNYLKGKGE